MFWLYEPFIPAAVDMSKEDWTDMFAVNGGVVASEWNWKTVWTSWGMPSRNMLWEIHVTEHVPLPAGQFVQAARHRHLSPGGPPPKKQQGDQSLCETVA